MKARTSSGMATKQVVMIVAAVALIAVAGLLIWRQVTGGGGPPKTTTLCCETCGKARWDQPTGALPRECPDCKTPTLQRAVQCGKCGHVCAETQLARAESDSPMEPALPKCPKCASPDINEPRQKAEPPK